MAEPPTHQDHIYIESLDALVRQVIDDLKTRTDTPELPTGLPLLDAAIWGLHRSEVTVVAARPGEGKCLGKGTPVMLADGTVKFVEDLRVGDCLMGPDSRPRHITSVCRGVEPLYEIQQRNGLWYTVNASHVLSLLRGGREVRNLSVVEYLGQSAKFKHQYKGYKVPVEFPACAVPMPPYLLGVWLGDGTSQEAAITTQDEPVRLAWQAYAERLGLRCKNYNRPPRCPTYRIVTASRSVRPNPVEQVLKGLGIFGKGKKAIPACYQRNSRAIRLELLAGLLDTDGAKNQGGLIFYNTNPRLAQQVCELARTLGFRAQCTPYTASLKSRNYTCRAYKVTLGGRLSQIPLRLPRKAQSDSTTHTGLATNFKVVPRDIGEYYGFTLKESDGLFLLGDCTVTHNTTLALQISRHLADRQKRVLFVSLEMTRHQLAERVLVQLTQFEAWNLRQGKRIEEFLAKLAPLNGFFKSVNLRLVDGIGYTVPQLQHLLNQMVAHGGGAPDVLIIDFIQLIAPEGLQKFDAIAEYLRAVKELAMRYRMAVLLCSQVNREGGKQLKLRPKLEHLKGSGALEELADCVIMCWWQELGTEENPQGVRYWLCIEKQRHGPPGQMIPVRFDKERLTFHALDESVAPWQGGEGEAVALDD